MFGVSSVHRRVSALLTALVAVILIGLAGCGEKKAGDPYVYDSLRRITRGDTLSTNFLFEIDAPQFDYVRGNTGMIRDGNLLEFLVANDLERNYRNLAGAQLGVQKTFTPQPTHFVLKRIKRNGVVEADSLPRPARYTLPTLLRAGAVDLETPGAALPDMGYSSGSIKEARATFLPEKEGDPLKAIQTGIANFVYVPRHDLTGAAQASPSPEDFAWYAVFKESTVEIVDLTPGADWMLHLLKDKGLPLVGSFSLTYLEDQFSLRNISHPRVGHVVGKMKINWFKFANTFVEGSVRD